jgi:hypothetical protein
MVQCSARCCPVALSPDQGGGQPDTAAATGEPGQVCSMLGKGPSVAGARDRWSRCCFIIVHALLGGVLRCRSIARSSIDPYGAAAPDQPAGRRRRPPRLSPLRVGTPYAPVPPGRAPACSHGSGQVHAPCCVAPAQPSPAAAVADAGASRTRGGLLKNKQSSKRAVRRLGGALAAEPTE